MDCLYYHSFDRLPVLAEQHPTPLMNGPPTCCGWSSKCCESYSKPLCNPISHICNPWCWNIESYMTGPFLDIFGVNVGKHSSIMNHGSHLGIFGYGSIPINTIFSGMNIHLPAILMFTRGTRFWHTAIYDSPKLSLQYRPDLGGHPFLSSWKGIDPTLSSC